jgi:hypothetical protein
LNSKSQLPMSGNLKICCQSEQRKTQIQLNKNVNLFSFKTISRQKTKTRQVLILK